MNEEIVVGVFTVRTVKMDPSCCLTADNDIPAAYGTVKTFVRAYFSEQLEEHKELIYSTIGHITNQVTKDYIKVAPDEPWVDTTPLKRIFEENLTSEVVSLLSDVLPDYKFRVVKFPEEAKQLIKKVKEKLKNATGRNGFSRFIRI
ncbi:MAG: hypothetical protein K2L89_01175 [Muribaculaceae bacterium]|nr:hypothetical protein [Muribaculaceae bacterium]